MITQQELKAWLHYDQDTGQFTRIEKRRRWAKGSIAGSVHPKGYIWVCRTEGGKNVNYMAHRLAWLWMTGEWPAEEVDHINGIRDDNRWVNLRQASREQNNWNTNLRQDNSSGYKGVSRTTTGTRWQAHINEGGRRKYLGSFDTAEAAHAVAQAARQAAHGGYAR